MLNKNYIKDKFINSINTYDSHAFIQEDISKKLIADIPDYKYANILEIGSYTGLLTKKIIATNPEFESYVAVDIVKESESYINKINKKISFINCDIENFNSEDKYDLIVSNAALQWCFDFKEIYKKLGSFLAKNGVIAISIFSEGNLYEIKDAFGISLNYPDKNYILNMQNEGIISDSATIKSESVTVKFEKSVDILKHLKYTGVNSLGKNISVNAIKEGLKILEQKYSNSITYKPLYIIDKHH